MKENNPLVDRRKVLKATGASVLSVSAFGVSTAKGSQDNDEGGSSDDDDVTTEAITSASVSFDDPEISVSDYTVMSCEWQVNNYAIPCDIYNVDAMIDYSGISEPETVSSPSDFSGEWEHSTVNPDGGDSWRCQEDGVILCDGTFTLEAKIDPTETGEYNAYCGASAIGLGDYSEATLTVTS